MKRLLSVLFWSVIAAAFIGPGTVTTAASAGAGYGYALLWALLFSTLATLVLQEAAARVTVISGRNLGEGIRERFHGGPSGVLVLALVLGAVVLGNAAYEAGNILGAVAGARLGIDLPPRLLTLAIGAGAGVVLWVGTPRAVAHLLSVTVAVMGVAMMGAASLLRPSFGAILEGSLLPSLPAGSGLLVLALVGTTVVPYNLFLGSGIAGGQELRELRFGLAVAVLLGGLISMAMLVVGTALVGEFGFESLGAVLEQRLGAGGGWLLAWGLFAAGLSSAITAPLAAAVTARSLFGAESSDWSSRSWRYRSVWSGVLVVGVAVGLSGVRPVPVIILAQALNGILLPFAAVFLFLVVNDRELMGERVNGALANLAMAAVVMVVVVLGTTSVVRAAVAAARSASPGGGVLLAAGGTIALLTVLPVTLWMVRRRRALAATSAADR